MDLLGNVFEDEQDILITIRAAIAELEIAESAILESMTGATKRQGARGRILAYLQAKGIGEAVTADELRRVSGIQEWGRRVRELRVEQGWDIRVDGSIYRLWSTEPDLELAKAWKTANRIRRDTSLSSRDKILEFCKANLRRTITDESLRYVSGDADPSRLIRGLRTQLGYPLSTEIERPELGPGEYILESSTPLLDAGVRKVSDSVRRRVFERDDYRCVICHRRGGDDGILIAHQLIAKIAGGSEGDIDNFVSLCHEHHESAAARGEQVLRIRERSKKATP